VECSPIAQMQAETSCPTASLHDPLQPTQASIVNQTLLPRIIHTQ